MRGPTAPQAACLWGAWPLIPRVFAAPFEPLFDKLPLWGPGTTPTWAGRSPAPLDQCAELLDVATIRELAANVEPYLRADGTKIWSLMQLERQLRLQAYRKHRGGYIDRRRSPAADSEHCPRVR